MRIKYGFYFFILRNFKLQFKDLSNELYFSNDNSIVSFYKYIEFLRLLPKDQRQKNLINLCALVLRNDCIVQNVENLTLTKGDKHVDFIIKNKDTTYAVACFFFDSNYEDPTNLKLDLKKETLNSFLANSLKYKANKTIVCFVGNYKKSTQLKQQLSADCDVANTIFLGVNELANALVKWDSVLYDITDFAAQTMQIALPPVVNINEELEKSTTEEATQEISVPAIEQIIETRDQESNKVSNFKELEKINFKLNANYLNFRSPRQHQSRAIISCINGLKEHERGKLIMACGTGKTYTSLKIVHEFYSQNIADFPITKNNSLTPELNKQKEKKLPSITFKLVLFLVPSLSLLNQTLVDWLRFSMPLFRLQPLILCSDTSIGNGDHLTVDCPVTTDPLKFVQKLQQLTQENADTTFVIFSTYQSIKVLKEAQKLYRTEYQQELIIDLAICDESHRTTGTNVTTYDENETELKKTAQKSETHFQQIHENKNIKARRRLYMTATPKIYTLKAQEKAETLSSEKNSSIEIISMDQQKQYGEAFFVYNFDAAVNDKILCDYSIVIGNFNVQEHDFLKEDINLSDEQETIKILEKLKSDKVIDTTNFDETDFNMAKEIAKFCNKIEIPFELYTNYIATWKCFNKIGADFLKDDKGVFKTAQPINKALIFVRSIEESKLLEFYSDEIINHYKKHFKQKNKNLIEQESKARSIKIVHVDGTQTANERANAIAWLQADDDLTIPENERKIKVLSNVRCLSEGVDVPALDAVSFLNAVQSQVDIIQAVGRIMRIAPNKKIGYIVIPLNINHIGIKEKRDDKQLHAIDREINKTKLDKVFSVVCSLRSQDKNLTHECVVADFQSEGNAHLNPSHIIMLDSLSLQAKKATPKDKEEEKMTGDGSEQELGENNKPKEGDLFEDAVIVEIVKRNNNNEYWETWVDDIKYIVALRRLQLLAILGKLDVTGEEPQYRFIYEDYLKTIASEEDATKSIYALHGLEINNYIKANADKDMQKDINELTQKLRNDVNQSISDTDIINMITQYNVSEYIFKNLYNELDFSHRNPLAILLSAINNKFNHLINPPGRKLSTNTLDYTFSNFVKSTTDVLSSAATFKDKQSVINRLYEDLIKIAFKDDAEKLGVVFTPMSAVNFIVKSTDYLLRKHFDSSLLNPNTTILDPFSGTGSFSVALLHHLFAEVDSKKDNLEEHKQAIKNLEYKYEKKMYLNEIIPISYFMSTTAVESLYYEYFKNAGITKEYVDFKGACFTDSFNLYENSVNANLIQVQKNNQISSQGNEIKEENAERIKRQQEQIINVIMTNPPYSSGQSSANDDNANETYQNLAKSIRDTYNKQNLKGVNASNLSDSYVKAIRMASDYLRDKNNDRGGVISFIVNGSFIDTKGMNGLRKVLKDEFSDIYIINLRGNATLSGEASKKEGDKFFGSASRTTVCILFLVLDKSKKLPNTSGNLHYYEVKDYATLTEKIELLTRTQSIEHFISDNPINEPEHFIFNDQIETIRKFNATMLKEKFIKVGMDKKYNWRWHRNDLYDNLLSLNLDYVKNSQNLFTKRLSGGCVTHRDTWVCNSNSNVVINNVKKMIEFVNAERVRFFNSGIDISKIKKMQEKYAIYERFVAKPNTKVKWCSDLFKNSYNQVISFVENIIRVQHYRPFIKQYMYLENNLINTMGDQDINYIVGKKNPTIILTNQSAVFSALMIDHAHEYGFLCGKSYPLYIHSSLIQEDNKKKKNIPSLFNEDGVDDEFVNNISAEKVLYLNQHYNTNVITHEDIFYYVYGMVHSSDYKFKFANNLRQEDARIPIVSKLDDFLAFSKIGRDLGDLHMNYEEQEESTLVSVVDNYKGTLDDTIEHYSFKERPKISTDKRTLIFNKYIKIENIPDDVYKYHLSGRSALELFIKDKLPIGIHSDSKISNNFNDFALEYTGDMRYTLSLILKLIHISVETVRLVKELPPLEYDENKQFVFFAE